MFIGSLGTLSYTAVGTNKAEHAGDLRAALYGDDGLVRPETLAHAMKHATLPGLSKIDSIIFDHSTKII